MCPQLKWCSKTSYHFVFNSISCYAWIVEIKKRSYQLCCPLDCCNQMTCWNKRTPLQQANLETISWPLHRILRFIINLWIQIRVVTKKAVNIKAKKTEKNKPVFQAYLLNASLAPVKSTRKGPISCVAPYPTEEHPGPENEHTN